MELMATVIANLVEGENLQIAHENRHGDGWLGVGVRRVR